MLLKSARTFSALIGFCIFVLPSGENVSAAPSLPTFRTSRTKGDADVRFVVWSPDSQNLLASVRLQRQYDLDRWEFWYEMQTWNIANASLTRAINLEQGKDFVNNFGPIEMSSNGQLTAAYNFQTRRFGSLELRDFPRGKLLVNLDVVGPAVFSADNRLVVGGSDYSWNTVTLSTWNWRANKILKSLQITAPQDRFFVPASTSGAGGGPPQWSIAPDARRGVINLWKKGKQYPGFTPSAPAGLLVFDASNGKHLFRVAGSLAFYAGPLVVTLDTAKDKATTVRLWNTDNGRLHSQFVTEHRIDSAVLSPDNRVLATLSDEGSFTNSIRIWNAQTGALLQTLQGHSKTVNCLAFSPNGKLLASGSDDGTIKLWQVKTSAIGVSTTKPRVSPPQVLAPQAQM